MGTLHAVTTQQLADWLLEHIDSIRMDETAGALFRDFETYTERIEQTIDHRVSDVFCGRCESPDVRVEITGAAIGPVCCWKWATDGHESCRAIITGAVTMTPIPTVCGTDLYAKPGEAEITCIKCGREYSVREQKNMMLAKSESVIAPAVEIASALTGLLDQGTDGGGKRLSVEVTSAMIRAMAARSQILDRGLAPDGRARQYRLGDVLKVLRGRQERESSGRSRRVVA